MNHLSGTPHMPQNFRSQPQRRQNDYHYPSPSHHHHHPHHHHVPLPNPGPPPQPHHLPYPAYPYPPPYHNLPIQQHPQQWYQPYQHYAPPPPVLARQFHHHQPPQHQQPQHSQHQQPQPPQPPLIVSSQPHPQPSAPYDRNPPPPARTPQPDISTPSTTSQNVVSASTTPTTNSVISNSSTTATKPPPSAPRTSSPVTVTAVAAAAAPTPATTPAPAKRIPYYPSLPWLSVPEEIFPPRALRRRRRRKPTDIPAEVELPARSQDDHDASEAINKEPPASQSSASMSAAATETEVVSTTSKTLDATPPEQAKLSPTLPPTPPPPVQPVPSHKRTATKPVVPVIPILPINKVPPKSNITSPPIAATQPEQLKLEETAPSTDELTPVASPPTPVKAPPKLWAELLRSGAPAANRAGPIINPSSSVVANGTLVATAASLSDVLRFYNIGNDSKVSFLEPRGLVNTGNVCYMNSILQILVFCVPFYDFLEQIGKRMVHNFKSETPLIEAMIMFMREYQVIDSTFSVEQLRLRLKDNELEQYGEPFIPEYVYDVIKRLPRFSTMRDAEEFLGFLLEGLHDECVHVMRGSSTDSQSQTTLESSTSPTGEKSESESPAGNGWMEVGPKQKAAVTRSAGSIIVESPITKIFGGKLRSVFRVPGLKDSVTLTPYQPLQLDIGAPNIYNITDALKGLTRSETLTGEFNSPRGPGTTATKQDFIETLPTVLILHLKRFHYDNAGGTTQKIWKKVGYPLDLEIPKEVFPQHQRASLVIRPGGLPKYRLIGVVYHHGKNANGGHYTVDVRRQEGREWIRIDDTVIRRVRTEDVAAEGSEEDPKVLVKALEQHKRDQEAGKDTLFKASAFGGLNNEESVDGNDEDEEARGGWSQVNGHSVASPTTNAASSKKWSSAANSDATPKSGEQASGKQTPRGGLGNKFSAKDNKVAYILFYQQIHP